MHKKNMLIYPDLKFFLYEKRSKIIRKANVVAKMFITEIAAEYHGGCSFVLIFFFFSRSCIKMTSKVQKSCLNFYHGMNEEYLKLHSS